MERHLCGLTHCTEENQQHGRVQCPLFDAAVLCDVNQRRDVERTCGPEEEDNTNEQTHVSNSSRDKRLLGRLCRSPPLVPEPDE